MQQRRERFDALLTEWDAACRSCIYLFDESEPPEANVHFVFADKGALEAVRFRSFVRDCRAIERPATELERAVSAEMALLERFIEEQHAEVIRSYDPKVTRFRERRMVMLVKGAGLSA